MAVPDRPGVTPAGIRDGRAEELQALVALRGPAVLAYCEAVCAPHDAPRAAAEAFARFRAAVVDSVDPATVDPDRLLLAATRHAAASLARPGRASGGLLRRPRPTPQCAQTAGLLAARASGVLSAPERQELAQHLARCPACRELERAFEQAEELYRSPPDRPVRPRVAETILETMAVAAPVVGEDDDEVGTAELDAVAEPESAEPEAVEPDDEEAPASEPPAARYAPAEPPVAEDVWEEPDPEDEVLEDPFPPPSTGAEAPMGVRPVSTRTRPGDRGLDPRAALLPIGVIALAVIVTLAVAGVFGGDEADPPRAEQSSPAHRVEEPVTTPLPVTVPRPEPPASTTTTPATTTTTPAAPPAGTDTGASAPTAPGGDDDSRAAGTADDGDLEVGKTDGGTADGSDGSGGTPTFDPDAGGPPPG